MNGNIRNVLAESAESGPIARHYTPKEIAVAWGVHENTIRRLFADEVGVLKLSLKKRGRREYVTLRIPPSVLQRVYAERVK